MIFLKQYRDIWLFEKVTDVIGFYPREFYVFDNFSAFAIDFQGRRYPTVEHAYQSLSFRGNNDELADTIMCAKSAHDAQKIAYENRSKRRQDWDMVKVSIMKDLLRAKIDQHPYVRKKLLETEDYLIVEDSPKDSFWGWGETRTGENALGKIWMELRNEIRNTDK